MKVTSKQLLETSAVILAGVIANQYSQAASYSANVQKAIDLAKELIEAIPDKIPKKKHDTSKLFIGFPWRPGGVTRSEMESWLKDNSGYTSNRAMQTIINNALAEGVTHKDLKTGKYHPGADGTTA